MPTPEETINATLVNKQTFINQMQSLASAIAIPTDDTLDIHSDHPIQNKAVAAAIGDLEDALLSIRAIVGDWE